MVKETNYSPKKDQILLKGEIIAHNENTTLLLKMCQAKFFKTVQSSPNKLVKYTDLLLFNLLDHFSQYTQNTVG